MIILVIGGERGIGKAMADQLLKAGHTLITSSRSFDQLQHFSEKHWTVHLDITNENSIQHLSEQLEHEFNHIDWIINCAGVLHTENYMPEKSLSQLNANQLNDNYMTNAVGHLLTIKALQKLITKSQNPVITSISARIGSIDDNHLGGWFAYRMSKAALNMGMKTLAIEWHRKFPKVKFLLLHPGTTDTDLSAPFQKNLPKGQLQSVESTASMLIEQIKQHQNHSSKFPLFLDYTGKNIKW